jgi:hypothetical protein
VDVRFVAYNKNPDNNNTRAQHMAVRVCVRAARIYSG